MGVELLCEAFSVHLPCTQGDDVFPIPGSSNRLHVEENVAAYEISRALTPADLQQIEGAASVTPSAAASRDGSAPS